MAITEKDDKIEELKKKILELAVVIHSKLGQKDSDQYSLAKNPEDENIIREAFEAVVDSDTSEEESFCEEEIFFFCDHCNFKTRKEKGIKVHIGRVHSLKCETCDKKFISVEKLERHMKVKTLVDNLGETRSEDGLELSKYRQAGLSRATLEISSECSSIFFLRTQRSHSTHFEVIVTPEVVFHSRSSSFMDL